MHKHKAVVFAHGLAVIALLLSILVWPTGAKAGTNAWTLVTSPNPGTNNLLRAVSAYDQTHVWAAGYYDDGSGLFRTLIMHYNTGVSPAVWVQDSAPNGQLDADNRLWGISARAANDAWAAGEYTFLDGRSYTLIEHWNGANWNVSTSANPNSQSNDFRAVSANPASANDVWAVGSYGFGGYTLIEHWNGSAWSVVPSPSPSSGFNVLYGVTTISTNDAWAVGYKGGASSALPLALHWNGSSWTETSPAQPAGATNTHLQGVSSVNSNPNDVWAVGYYDSSTGRKTATYHFAGIGWQYVTSPNPDAGDEFNAVAPVSTNNPMGSR
jgi:hypothetical protein